MKTTLMKFGLMFLTPFAATTGVFAGTVSWLGGNGVWSDTAKWSGGALPATGDDAYVTNGVAGETQILYQAPTVERLENLYLDSGGSGTLVVTQAQDRLEIQHQVRLGTTSGSTVKYVQTGGTNIFSVGYHGVFAVGFQTGSTGVYHLVDGALAGNGDYGGFRSNVQLGPGGHGTFIQDGGVFQGSTSFTALAHDNRHLILGGRHGYNWEAYFLGFNGGTGNYVQNAGAVCFSLSYLGGDEKGVGTFTLNGGTNRIDTIYVGSRGRGHFIFNGGDINNTTVYLGQDGGTGVWTHANGVLDADAASKTRFVRIYAGYSGMNDDGAVGAGIFNMQGGTFRPYYSAMQIGVSGRGVLNVTGGTMDLTNNNGSDNYVAKFGVDNGGFGTLNLSGGTLRVRTLGAGNSGVSTGEVWHTGGALEVGNASLGGLIVGRGNGSAGIYHFGNDAQTGSIVNQTTYKNDMTIRQSAGARGVFRGWGVVTLDDTLVNNGIVIADGHGVDRTLALSSFTTLSNMIENASSETYGWYAINGGRLTLPPLTVPTGSATRNWGESADDAVPDLVNSLRFAFTGVTTGGSLSASLEALDRNDIPAVPKGVLSVWRIEAPASMAFAALDLTTRYDHEQSVAQGLDAVNFYRWNGAAWKALPSTDDSVAKTASATLDALAGTVYLAAGNIPPTATTVIVR